jgi:hypothetical protein
MIAERQTVGPSIEDRLGMVCRNPDTGRCILAVHHDEIERPVIAQARQTAYHRIAARPSDDITKEENFHAPCLRIGAATCKARKYWWFSAHARRPMSLSQGDGLTCENFADNVGACKR